MPFFFMLLSFAVLVAALRRNELLCNDAWHDAADFVMTSSCSLRRTRSHYDAFGVNVVFVEQSYARHCASSLPLNGSLVLLSSNNGDYCAPIGAGVPGADAGDSDSLLRSPTLLAWFSTNVAVVHAKLHALPLGPKVQWESRAFHGEEHSKTHLLQMLQRRAKLNFADVDRPNFIDVSLSLGTADSPMCRVLAAAQSRRDSAEHFRTFTPPHSPLDKVECKGASYLNHSFSSPQHAHQEAYFRRLRCSKFVVAPQGNGIDTHRVWEALYMGAIPIVIDFAPMRSAYERLPVLLVHRWSEVTAASLERNYTLLHERIGSFDWSRLLASRWRREITRTILERRLPIRSHQR